MLQPPNLAPPQRTYDGRRWFSRACMPQAQTPPPKFAAISWNARALATRDETLMRRKMRFLRKIIACADVVALQEVHGNIYDLNRILNSLKHEWSWHLNPGPTHGTGGVAFLCRRKAFPQGLVFEDLIAGRVSRARCEKDSFACTLWNVHNQELAVGDIDRINRRINSDVDEATLHPTEKIVWLMGDLNFSDAEELEKSLADPSGALRLCDPRQARRHTALANQWPALRRLTEIRVPEPTHFCKQTNSLSVLDRVFVSLPGWAFTRVSGQAGTLANPVRTADDGLSDHAPVWAKLEFQQQTGHRGARAPLLAFLFKHKDFAPNHERLCQQMRIEEMEPERR